MQKELAAEGVDVNFLSVNAENANTELYQGYLIDKCAFPLFQDTLEDNVWALMDGGKDDFYIYDPKGVLWKHLPFGGDVNTDLGDPEGYAAVKTLLLQAVSETQ